VLNADAPPDEGFLGGWSDVVRGHELLRGVPWMCGNVPGMMARVALDAVARACVARASEFGRCQSSRLATGGNNNSPPPESDAIDRPTDALFVLCFSPPPRPNPHEQVECFMQVYNQLFLEGSLDREATVSIL
jgi:hypothetical protein